MLGLGRATVAILLALAALACFPAVAPGQGTFDFGDAPSTGTAGYETAPAAPATFPTTAATNGPRHTGGGALRLGLAWSAEAAPRLIDADGDDGMSLRQLRTCAASQINVLVDARRIPRAQRRNRSFTLNGWFDWNRDGSWDDAGCSVEWAIQNARVPFSALGANGVGLVPVSFRGGEQVSEFWYRMTVTLDALPGSFSGAMAAQLGSGETEDARHRSPDAVVLPKLRIGGGGSGRGRDWNVRCNPNPLEMRHGERRRITFDVDPRPVDGGTIDVSRTSPRSDRFEIDMHRTGRVPGRRASFVDGFDFKSTRVHSPTKTRDLIEKRAVKFRFRKDGRVQDLTCRVRVVHERAIKLVFPGEPARPPAVVVPGGGAGVPGGGDPGGGDPGGDPPPVAPDLQWTSFVFSWLPGGTAHTYDAVAATEDGGAVVAGTKKIDGVKYLAVATVDANGQRGECGGDGDYEGQQVTAVRDVDVAGVNIYLLVERQEGDVLGEIVMLSLENCMPLDSAVIDAGPGDDRVVALQTDGGRICATGSHDADGTAEVLLVAYAVNDTSTDLDISVVARDGEGLGSACNAVVSQGVTVAGTSDAGAFVGQVDAAGSGAGLLDGDGFVGPFNLPGGGSLYPTAVTLTNGGAHITTLGQAIVSNGSGGGALTSFAAVIGKDGATLTPARDANFIPDHQELILDAAPTSAANVLGLGVADAGEGVRLFAVNIEPAGFSSSDPTAGHSAPSWSGDFPSGFIPPDAHVTTSGRGAAIVPEPDSQRIVLFFEDPY